MLSSRRPSAATVVAVLVTLVVGSQTGLAAHLTQNDHKDPQALKAVRSIDVVAADESSVTIDWPPSQDNHNVVGYAVYVNATQIGTVTPEQLRRWRDKGRDRESFSYTVGDLECGTSYTVAVDAFDGDDNHSPMMQATVSTAACPETTPPSAPTENPMTPSSAEDATTPSSTSQKAASPSPSTETTASPSSSTQDTETPSSSTGAAKASPSTRKTAPRWPRRTDKLTATARSAHNDGVAPQAVTSIEVTTASASSVTIGWPATRDNQAVAGYGIYVNDVQNGTVTPDLVLTSRKRDGAPSISYRIDKLACGTGYTVGVDAFDRQDNHSPITQTTVSTSACPDSTPPSSPSDVRQVATTENSVMLAWSPSTDNVGVVEYGLYASGLRVATVHDANAALANLKCGTSYLVGIDAADAAGNRSAQTSAYFRTSACPVTNQPPSTPAGLKVTTSTQTSVTLAWSPSTDDLAVSGYGLYASGKRTSETTETAAVFSGLQCGTTYALGVDAFDGAGARSTVAQLTAATTPCSPPPSTNSPSLTQTITNGETLSGDITWHAVYDSNGDKVPDDPGAVRFLVDGKVVLTEQSMPFGDTAGFWTSNSVTNGHHTFEVPAVNGAGTTMATNTVTATVANDTAPAGDTTAPSTPGSLRVMAATPTSVSVAWSASTDNVGSSGYGLYRGASQTGQTQQTTATFSGLACGTAYQVGVDAYDAAGNRSSRADLSVTTSPCPDTQPPPRQPTSPPQTARGPASP